MLKLPYGKTYLELDAPDAAVLTSGIDRLHNDEAGLVIVREAMAHPINSPSLETLAKDKKTCTIIISDHTRPVPSRDILPPMLQALKSGNPDIAVTLLVATGCHRATQKQELVDKLGEDIVAGYPIVIHDCRDANANVQIGILPSGAPLVIDKTAVKCDLLIAEGFIEPHFFAGFSGGRKSVLPGVCDRVSVLGNHCSRFIDSPFARTGILDGNPLHTDMLAAAKMAKLAYIVNVVIDENKKTVAAFAGDCEKAHRAGCDFLKEYCAVKPVPADVVITTNGGAPLDQNIYQCVKSMTAAEATAREGGVIILCAECADGTGGEDFYRSLKACESADALYAGIMQTTQQSTIPDQWESQILARILKKHRVVMVTRPALADTVRDMKMEYARTLTEALQYAYALKGEGAALTVIPNGISVIVG
ncbi:MAG: nickel-dependent lactate racemase [Clostridia bacterium]|nr:nickel-dependent lactate racemase [Clostridia bacterium]